MFLVSHGQTLFPASAIVQHSWRGCAIAEAEDRVWPRETTMYYTVQVCIVKLKEALSPQQRQLQEWGMKCGSQQVR